MGRGVVFYLRTHDKISIPAAGVLQIVSLETFKVFIHASDLGIEAGCVYKCSLLCWDLTSAAGYNDAEESFQMIALRVYRSDA